MFKLILNLLTFGTFAAYLTTVPKQPRSRGWNRLEQDILED